MADPHFFCIYAVRSTIPPKKAIKQIKKKSAVEQKSSPNLNQLIESLSDMKVELKVGVKGVSTVNGTDLCKDSPYIIDIPPALGNALSSVFSGNKTYRFRLMRTATLVTSGAGVMNLVTRVYPSQFDQYGALSLLFNECRLRTTSIRYTGDIAPGVTTVVQGTWASAFDPSASSLVGTSHTFTSALRLPKAKTWSLIMSKWPVSNSFRQSLRPWSAVIATSTGSDPVGGVEGAWVHCVDGTVSASATYLTYVILADYEFRNVH